jgi:hypothetical protein
MKGDFSRIRFNQAKNYTAVLQQQGRVALDADANEQTAIDAYLRESTNLNVIGRFGGPDGDAGFAIEFKDGKIRIGPGRYYVDGILVVNDRHTHYAEQRFLIPPTGSGAEQISESALIAALEAGKTVQFVLEVWRRFVTELDDPCLVEPALGRADTTGRLQTIWRVLGVIGDTASATTTGAQAPTGGGVTIIDAAAKRKCQDPVLTLSSCCQLLYQSPAVQHTGRMSAGTTAGGDCGCQPVPAAGYQGLENQLYRVEIHTGGDFSAATFKWSRENASAVAQITNVNGASITVNTLGPDANLGYQVGGWVELSDDTYLYGDPPNQPGILFQIQSFGPNPFEVTLNNSAAGVVDPEKNARMRRWDQPQSSGTSAGIPLSHTPVPLENGIEVAFSKDGNYVSGDYWTIPARTADGKIDWACGADGDPFLPAQYFRIYTAPLACVHFAGKIPTTGDVNIDRQQEEWTGFIVDDCRLKFPPLNALSCGDQGPCTIVPKPGIGWEAPLLALKPGADADICFPVGKFPLTKTLVLKGLGNLRLTGGGFGTQILATGITAALLFDDCKSVQIADLFASTCTVRRRHRRSTTPPLGGLLSFSDCAIVDVESVTLKCGYAEERTASCIDVENTFVSQTPLEERLGTPINGRGEVRIRHCDLFVGGNQEGILLVRVQRAQIEDNTLVAWRPKVFTLAQRLRSPSFRASVLRQFISNARYVKAGTQQAGIQQPGTQEAGAQEAKPAETPGAPQTPATPEPSAPNNPPENTPNAEAAKAASNPIATKTLAAKTVKLNATVTLGGQTVQFQTHPLLKNFWQRYLETSERKFFSDNRDLLLYVRKTALDFLMNPKLHRDNSAIAAVITAIDKADQVVIGRAISVAGEGVQECRILNNSIHDAVQGITVGMSNHKKYPHKNESAGTVTIAGNQIYIGLPPGAQYHASQAIFVGNVNSLMVENNYAGVAANPGQLEREGIRTWGYFGRRVVVRHSHLAGFEPGILFSALSDPGNSTPLWLLADNMAENANNVCLQEGGYGDKPAITNLWINNFS